MATFIERNNRCRKLLTFPTAVYRPEVRPARNLAHTRNLHIQVHRRRLVGNRMKVDRKEPCCHSSQDRSLIIRTLAPAQFLHDSLGDGCGRGGGAHDYGVRACGDHGDRDLCLPMQSLWGLSPAG